MAEKIIARGAEAILLQQGKKLIKRRIKKSYRIQEIDEKLRKLRTRSEAKLMMRATSLVNVPKIFAVDEEKKEIVMSFVSGKKLSEWLDSFPLEKAKKLCSEIGERVAALHAQNIIHGDLTTSNMIFSGKKIYFIDFGLGFFSRRIEDKAVDIHLFRQALESKHFLHSQSFFGSFLAGYKKYGEEKVIKKLEKVEVRGRYKGKRYKEKSF